MHPFHTFAIFKLCQMYFCGKVLVGIVQVDHMTCFIDADDFVFHSSLSHREYLVFTILVSLFDSHHDKPGRR